MNTLKSIFHFWLADKPYTTLPLEQKNFSIPYILLTDPVSFFSTAQKNKSSLIHQPSNVKFIFILIHFVIHYNGLQIIIL